MMFRIGTIQMWSREIMEVKKKECCIEKEQSEQRIQIGIAKNIQFCNHYLVKAYKELSSVAEAI